MWFYMLHKTGSGINVVGNRSKLISRTVSFIICVVNNNIVVNGNDRLRVIGDGVLHDAVSCAPRPAAAAEDGMEGGRGAWQGQLRSYHSADARHEERSQRYQQHFIYIFIFNAHGTQFPRAEILRKE